MSVLTHLKPINKSSFFNGLIPKFLLHDCFPEKGDQVVEKCGVIICESPEIYALAYELYGLSEEEIRIVESVG